MPSIYIVNITTGEVMGETPFREDVADIIEDLTAMYPYENLMVLDENGLHTMAIDWDD